MDNSSEKLSEDSLKEEELQVKEENNEDLSRESDETANEEVVSQELSKQEIDKQEQIEAIKSLNLVALIEALLFVNSDPITLKRVSEISEATNEEVLSAIKELRELYKAETSGLQLVELKQGKEEAIQIRSKAEMSVALTKLKAGRPRRLSKPALETLSIIAYRQPIVKSDIDKIRGVDSSPTVKTLLERKLITIIGHQASVGQPALYATTDEFLSIFGLKNISDLPTLRELNEIDSEPGELPLQ